MGTDSGVTVRVRLTHLVLGALAMMAVGFALTTTLGGGGDGGVPVVAVAGGSGVVSAVNANTNSGDTTSQSSSTATTPDKGELSPALLAAARAARVADAPRARVEAHRPRDAADTAAAGDMHARLAAAALRMANSSDSSSQPPPTVTSPSPTMYTVVHRFRVASYVPPPPPPPANDRSGDTEYNGGDDTDQLAADSIVPPSVTLITQLSVRPHSRLTVMRSLVHAWEGPASVAVFIMTEDEIGVVADMYDSDPLLRKYVTLHLVLMPVSTWTDPLFVAYGVQVVYPINTLRNVALDNMHPHSDWAVHVDVDFSIVPAPRTHAFMSAALQRELVAVRRREPQQHLSQLVFVLPAFELLPGERAPTTKQELRRMYDAPKSESSLASFAADLCPACHGGTDYKRWFNTSESYFVPFTTRWEPYTVAHRTQPRYDEALTGRHLNKNMHIWDLACAGYRFLVLPDAFVLHTNKHEIVPYIQSNYDDMEAVWARHLRERRCVADMSKVRKWDAAAEPKFSELYMKTISADGGIVVTGGGESDGDGGGGDGDEASEQQQQQQDEDTVTGTEHGSGGGGSRKRRRKRKRKRQHSGVR